ncbi:MAG: hypothetical protein JSS63_00275 [Bacteroidetes bacterium]|nr:hypothetical protein [Bacteroidota bacterium]
MKDNLPQNTDEKYIKYDESKTLEQYILEDIEAYENGKDRNIPHEEITETEIQPEEQKTEEEKPEEEVQPKAQVPEPGESNYQINLINENLLRIRVKTKKGVNIDCSVKDTKSSAETQSNRLYLHPKSGNEVQEVEIIISIDPSTGELIVEKKKDENGYITPQPVITPNPAVENLIMPVDLGRPDEPIIPLTEDEILEQKIGKKNPYHLGRLLYRRNMTIGIISAVVFACLCTILFYNFYGKAETKSVAPESRLIILNDIPTKINFKEYEDPNKPKEEQKPPTTTPDPNAPPTIKQNIIRAPKIKRPRINTPQDSLLTNDATKELDSLRKLQASKDSLKKLDSLKNLTSKTDSMKIDSLSAFNNKDVGLFLPYKQFAPKWSLIDSRQINSQTTSFEGVLLVDSTNAAAKMNFFIFLDNDPKKFDDVFKDKSQLFPMADSSMIAYVLPPYTQIGKTTYSFYIFGKTHKINATLQVSKEFFEQYKPVAENIIKYMRVR